MKTLSAVIILGICSSSLLKASGGISAEFGVCNDLASSLAFRLDHEEKGLPTSWDDFEMVRIMKRGTMKHQLFSAKATNSFALVPGAPVIQPESGISREYQGYRLVFISREGSMTKSSGIGRCALLADPGGKNSKQFRVYPVFFPENIAQLILKQVEGFDPHKQPLAFDDLSPFEREESKFRENIKISLPPEEAKELIPKGRRENNRPPNSASSNETKAVEKNNSASGWIVTCSIVLIILASSYWLKTHRSI